MEEGEVFYSLMIKSHSFGDPEALEKIISLPLSERIEGAEGAYFFSP